PAKSVPLKAPTTPPKATTARRPIALCSHAMMCPSAKSARPPSPASSNSTRRRVAQYGRILDPTLPQVEAYRHIQIATNWSVAHNGRRILPLLHGIHSSFHHPWVIRTHNLDVFDLSGDANHRSQNNKALNPHCPGTLWVYRVDFLDQDWRLACQFNID